MKKSLVFILMSVAFWFIAYNAVTTAFSRYATHVWGLEGGGYADCLMIATVAAILRDILCTCIYYNEPGEAWRFEAVTEEGYFRKLECRRLKIEGDFEC